MFQKIIYLFVTLILISTFFYSCEVNSPSLPVWDVDLNLPFANKSYNIFDLVKHNNNIGADSLNNGLIFLYGESNYRRSFGEDIKFDGVKTSTITAPSTFQLDTFIVIDDSSYVRYMSFLNGTLNFSFSNTSEQPFSVSVVIENMFEISDNDTSGITLGIPAGTSRTMDFNLVDYYIKNDVPDNRLKLQINFDSPKTIAVNFDYTLSRYSIKKIEGRLKPLSTGFINDEVTDPFGTDVPEGELNFAAITPNKNFLTVKKFSQIYRVDFTQISITGENKNGRRVRLKYLKNGNEGDPIEPVFNLTLPADSDSLAFPINQNNSNILEFINNIPKVIHIERNDFLNLSYQEGTVNYTDSLSLKLSIQVPLDVSITKPIVFSDTVDVGINDEGQRKDIDHAKNLIFTLNAINGFPLKVTSKILILDSTFVPLIAITQIAGNLPDSTIIVNAAPVGPDGFVMNTNTTTFTAILDSANIQQIKRMGKMIYEYKLYTDPALIPPPLATVKLKGSDIISSNSFGVLKYRIDFNN